MPQPERPHSPRAARTAHPPGFVPFRLRWLSWGLLLTWLVVTFCSLMLAPKLAQWWPGQPMLAWWLSQSLVLFFVVVVAVAAWWERGP